MKRIAIFLLFLMLASVFVPCMSVRAEPSLVPHEDPAAVQSVMDSYSFLAQYADIFALMAAKNYDNASRLSEELSHITVPEDLSYVINRYNDLTQQLIGVLNDLQSTLDTASSLLDQYRLDEAGQALDHAGVLVAKAQILLGDLKDATLTLSQRLGVFAASADSKIRQAYDQLQTMLQRLLDLINQYHTLLQRANQRDEEIKSQNLDPTDIKSDFECYKMLCGWICKRFRNVKFKRSGFREPSGTIAFGWSPSCNGKYRFKRFLSCNNTDSLQVCRFSFRKRSLYSLGR